MNVDSEDPKDLDHLWSLLTHSSKLDRDKGLLMLEEILKGDEDVEKWRRYIFDKLCQSVSKVNNDSWETRLGFFQAAKTLFELTPNLDHAMLKFGSEALVRICLDHLTYDEVRVRMMAGELLGQLCKSVGPSVFESSKVTVLELIRSNLEREKKDLAELGESGQLRRSSSEAIFHDTAGWRFLETSMKALQFMAQGCGQNFQAYLDQNILDLVIDSLSHTNRFVRETGYFTLNAFIKSGSSFSFLPLIAEKIAGGMSDNWSQVRLAASMACRTFFLSIDPESGQRESFFPTLLPAMCLNRYYMAEGVRLYCQETWKIVVGERGRYYVEKYIREVIDFYILCTRADNHAVREAGCHCIAELAQKLDKGVLEPFIPKLLETLLICFEDDSWPVRDTACVASGSFVKAFPDHSRDKLDSLYPLFVGNLKDPISSVRQGGAIAIANAVRAYETDLSGKVIELIKNGLKGLKDQPVESERYADLSSEAATFGVVKKIRDNDIDLHENQPMYSCGSLAPKMGRGGCSDAKFRKPSEPWEFADGCVHLLAELTYIKTLHQKLHALLYPVAEACTIRHYTMHPAFLETVLKRLPCIAENLGKRMFKPYLEEFMEPIFYACECDNLLAKAAGEAIVRYLSSYLGPNIFRGRVEKYHPRYLNILDSLDSGCEPGTVMGSGSAFMQPSQTDAISMTGMAIPGGGTNRNPTFPSLGGTPT